jgi:hypothetical protein
MLKLNRLALLATLAFTGANAQTITFQNANPVATVKLELGSQLSLEPSGNLIARCDASDPTGCARLLQTGGGGQCGAGVSFTTQLNVTSPSPPAPGPYPGGSAITVAAQATGAVVCIPRANIVGGPDVTMAGWTNAITPSGSGSISQALTLPGASDVEYRLSLTCYGSLGSDTSSLVVRTSQTIIPPPPQCSQFPTAPFTNASAGQSAGVAMQGYTTVVIPGYESLQTILGFQLTPFSPSNGFGIVDGPPSRVRSIQFTVPQGLQSTAASEFRWAEWPNNYDPPKEGYFTVSECAGDFRFPAVAQSAPSASDSTFADGCRNWRAFQGSGFLDLAGVRYQISETGTSTGEVCVLRPGRTYFFNIIMNRPSPNRTMPPLPSPPNTLCGAAENCGIRAAVFL